MTLTPDRKRDEQNRRDEAASPAVSASEGGADEDSGAPTYLELLRNAGFDLDGHPLADRFDEVAAPPPDEFEFADAEHPAERTPLERAESSLGSDDGVVEQTEDGHTTSGQSGRWGGRSLWDASVDDPEAKAELQRRAAELDAEKEAWMRKKAAEAEAERASREDAADCCEEDEWAAFRGGTVHIRIGPRREVGEPSGSAS